MEKDRMRSEVTPECLLYIVAFYINAFDCSHYGGTALSNQLS